MKVRGVLGMASIAMSASVCGSMAWGALGAHEHGVADLTVAVEGQSVDLMLTAPTGDLVGFERAPASEQERASIRERVAALEAGSWFIWDGGHCEQVSVEVTLPAVLTVSSAAVHGRAGSDDADHHDHHGRQHDHEGHDHKGHDHGGHDHERHDHKGHDHQDHDHKGHDQEGHDQEGHDHDGHDHKGHDHKGHDHEGHDHDHAHMDGMVSWQYRCEAGVRLRSVDVELFELLPLERIRAQTISERGQGAGNLSPASRRLSLP